MVTRNLMGNSSLSYTEYVRIVVKILPFLARNKARQDRARMTLFALSNESMGMCPHVAISVTTARPCQYCYIAILDTIFRYSAIKWPRQIFLSRGWAMCTAIQDLYTRVIGPIISTIMDGNQLGALPYSITISATIPFDTTPIWERPIFHWNFSRPSYQYSSLPLDEHL